MPLSATISVWNLLLEELIHIVPCIIPFQMAECVFNELQVW